MIDWLLKYPATDFARGKLIFLGVWPRLGSAGSRLVVVALLAVGVGLILMSALRPAKLSVPRRALLGTLQALMLGIVALVLSQPALLRSSLAAEQNSIAVLLDDSASMTLADVDRTRLEQAGSVLDSPALASLARRYRLLDFVFAGSVQPVDGYHLLPLPSDRTDIGSAVQRVLQALHSSALGAVLVISDGDDSAGALSAEQLSQIAAYGVPVHTIGVGRVRMPEDLELADVTLPARALPGTTVVASARVRHDGPGATRLKVYDGDRFL
ncbi:MAG TPA: vWA domain-containing protein, partial [Steroidobacteraceae bacterium]|nr:vWA domain-containing protein [Steroidobacteraceae bacterium]